MVRQSFSHGRTKTVVVEKVSAKPRSFAPPRPAAPAPAPTATAAATPTLSAEDKAASGKTYFERCAGCHGMLRKGAPWYLFQTVLPDSVKVWAPAPITVARRV